jgi:hypothetical protein
MYYSLKNQALNTSCELLSSLHTLGKHVLLLLQQKIQHKVPTIAPYGILSMY